MNQDFFSISAEIAAIMMLGLKLGVPFEKTWSCYESEDKPCGYCVGCRGRAAAFKHIGEEDPLLK